MSVPAIIALVLVSILLLTSLVAFGVGHKRWSWVSVAASFLVVLTLGGYLYLAARLLQFEWRWVQSARATQVRIHEVRDAKRPSTDPAHPGRLEPIPDTPSLAELRQERDRWERAVERIDNWRGRHWDKASFRPPTPQGAAGSITLPAPAAAEPEGDGAAAGEAAPAAKPTGQAIDPGTIVYVFDETPATEGGLYLGAFLVENVAADPATGALTLSVAQTAPPDDYDRAAWSRAYDAVTVYDKLPADRWLAFSKVARSGAAGEGVDDGIAPRVAKRSDEELAELVPEPFREGVERHALSARDADERETVDEADWPAIRESLAAGETLPGEVWAEVAFKDQVDLDAFLGLEREGAAGDGADLEVEVELGKAFELEGEGKVTIRKVFRRRRLIDAATLVHGSVVPGGEAAGDVMADGLATLMRTLQAEIVALDAANKRLSQGQANVTAERALVGEQVNELTADLVKWERDVAAATKLADAFEAEAKRAAERLAATEQDVVRLGRELDQAVGEAVRGIDSVAPPAGRDAAAPAATF
ncbi:MAG: hypothetical protein ACKOCX_03115 [Planctomycetota bacterium]